MRADQQFAAAARRGDLVRACVLAGRVVDPGLEVEEVLARLDRLASSVEPTLAGLRAALGSFHGAAADYDRLESSLLHRVLDRKRGLPILLSVVWMAVGERAGIEVQPVALPGHFVVRVEGRLVDPFRGGADVTPDDLVHLLGRWPTPDDLAATGPDAVLLRVLRNVCAWADEHQELRTMLWALELSMTIPRHPVSLRRERGLVRARLGDFRGGAIDLEDFAAAVADVEAEAAEAARHAARMAWSQLN